MKPLTRTHLVHVHTHTHIHTWHTYTHSQHTTCMHAHTLRYTQIHTHTDTHRHTHTYTHTHTYALYMYTLGRLSTVGTDMSHHLLVDIVMTFESTLDASFTHYQRLPSGLPHPFPVPISCLFPRPFYLFWHVCVTMVT